MVNTIFKKPVGYPMAILLRKKGYNNICQNLWHYDGSDCIKMTNKNSENYGFSAPTIGEVVDWIWNDFGIWISVYEFKDHGDDVNDPIMFRTNKTLLKEFKTPLEAYLEAIQVVLNENIPT
jgi:hypothetical protein